MTDRRVDPCGRDRQDEWPEKIQSQRTLLRIAVFGLTGPFAFYRRGRLPPCAARNNGQDL
jgi:hypothetical protein